jgi:3-dehydroquinate dehydratase-2
VIVVLNGPNLGRLGTRQPEIYGDTTYEDLVATCHQTAVELACEVDVRQTDSESELIGWLHEAADSASGVVLNPGALTHYSYAVADAVAIVRDAGVPLIEVHISQPAAREAWRQTSVVSPYAVGSISGLGFDSYRLALRALADRKRA